VEWEGAEQVSETDSQIHRRDIQVWKGDRLQRQTQVVGCIKFALQYEAKVPDAFRACRSLTQTNSKSHSYQLKPLSVRLFCLALEK
jgi:hypothetical protein